MKKLLSLLLTVVMILCLVPTDAHAAGDPIEFVVSKTTLRAGETFTVTVIEHFDRIDGIYEDFGLYWIQARIIVQDYWLKNAAGEYINKNIEFVSASSDYSDIWTYVSPDGDMESFLRKNGYYVAFDHCPNNPNAPDWQTMVYPKGTLGVFTFKVRDDLEETVDAEVIQGEFIYKRYQTDPNKTFQTPYISLKLIGLSETYSVTLPDDFTTDADELTVNPGDSFTFWPKDPNYDYDITVTVDGDAIPLPEPVDGKYTIEDILGDVVITSEKTAKSFSVILGEDMSGENSATYMTDYTFILSPETGYSYRVTATVNENAYSGMSSVNNADGTITYTIPGKDITGPIALNSGKTAITGNEHTVLFTGNGVEDVDGSAASTVENGGNYFFTINKQSDYLYHVSATIDGSKKPVNENEAGHYTIENVTGDLIINVNKIAELNCELSVSPYIESDGKTIFLITATGTPSAGKAFAYDGNAMYKTTGYGENVYSWLVTSETVLTEWEALEKITEIEASSVIVSPTFDANLSGIVDINDAQFAYELYRANYDDLGSEAVRRALSADIDGNKTLDIADVVAIVMNIE